jgi:hypothetical protein
MSEKNIEESNFNQIEILLFFETINEVSLKCSQITK